MAGLGRVGIGKGFVIVIWGAPPPPPDHLHFLKGLADFFDDYDCCSLLI